MTDRNDESTFADGSGRNFDGSPTGVDPVPPLGPQDPTVVNRGFDDPPVLIAPAAATDTGRQRPAATSVSAQRERTADGDDPGRDRGPSVTTTTGDATVVDEGVERVSVLRVPRFSFIAVIIGALTAWGSIAVAASILERVNVPYGFNLGLADGGPGDDGFWPGLWALVVSAGAFLVGGYAAARMARANGTKHAIGVWVLAMAATAVDALIENMRDGTEGVLVLINGVPYWSETGLTESSDAVLVLMAFGAAALIGALLGGALGQAANKIDRHERTVLTT